MLEASETEEEYHQTLFASMLRDRNCLRLIYTNLSSPFNIILITLILFDAILSALGWYFATGETFYLDERHFPTEWLNPVLLNVHYAILAAGLIGFVLNSRFCLLIYCLSLLIQCNFLLFDMFIRFDLLICSCFACKLFVFIFVILAHLRLDNSRLDASAFLSKQRQTSNNNNNNLQLNVQTLVNDNSLPVQLRRGSA